MTRPVFVSMLALSALTTPAWAQRTVVGTLSIVRHVEVTRTRATPQIRDRVERVLATQGEEVFSEEFIRTLKRSSAEVAFQEGTLVRLKDRSEAIFRQEKSGGGVYVISGSIWVKVGATPIVIETPVGTVTAQKAILEVSVEKDAILVNCFEGTATLRRETRSVPLKGKEFAGLRVTGTQVSLDAASEIHGDQLPRDWGGPREAWWQLMDRERGMLVFPGSSAGFALRSSTLTEALQATVNVPPAPSEIVNNAADKARLLSISQATVVPAIERTLASDTTLNLSGYRQKFGGDDLSQAYSLSGGDLSFLRGHGIGNVGELFDALNATGASFGVDLRSRLASRSVYRPSAWQGASNVRKTAFDGTQRSNALSFLGVAAAALLDRGSKLTDVGQDVEAFGVTSDPAALGGRVRLHGAVGKSHYDIEGNYLRLLTGKNTNSYNALSVASVEREMGTGVTAFAGRRRFYSGPALLNLSYSQLLGDRYSALGATVNKNGVKAEAAWLYDSNPDVRGAQGGFLASATKQVGAGTFGAQALRVGSLSGGTGFSVSGSVPTSKGPTQMDLYGELGVAPDKSGVVTLGLYFPWIYQASDTDVFLEYSSHQDVSSSFMIVANRALTQGINLRAYFGSSKRTLLNKNNAIGGVGISYALGR